MGTTQNNMLTKVIFTAAVATSVQAGILNDLKNKAENVGSNIGTGVPNLQHIKPATGSVTGSATGSVTGSVTGSATSSATGSATGSVTGSQPIMQTGSANLGTGISNHQHTKPATGSKPNKPTRERVNNVTETVKKIGQIAGSDSVSKKQKQKAIGALQ